MRYTVEWERASAPGVKLTCTNLTGTVAFARLLNALKESGPIVVTAITPERSA